MTPVPDVSTNLLVDLVNEYGAEPRTIAGEADQPYVDLRSMLTAQDVPDISPTELVTVADRFWPLFAAPTAHDKARILNELLDQSGLAPAIDCEARTRWSTSHSLPEQVLLAGCAVTLLNAVTASGWQRLGTCDGEDCVDVHLDITGRNRRYCSTVCLNRARIRAYRARRRAPAA